MIMLIILSNIGTHNADVDINSVEEQLRATVIYQLNWRNLTEIILLSIF